MKRLWRWRKYHKNLKTQRNINLVKNNLKEINDYFLRNTNNIIEIFKNKFKNYLLAYVEYSKNLYDSLYIYTNNKISNNDNINNLIEAYRGAIKGILQNKTYDNLLLNNNDFCSPDIYVNNLEENINLIKDNYYTLYYSYNKSQFLEYPKEIIPKIRAIEEQLIKGKDIIKNKINSLYKKKVFHVFT